MASRGLGRGLDALIPGAATEATEKKPVSSTKKTSPAKKEEGSKVFVRIEKVVPNKEQPRKNFDEDELDKLSDSIKQHGIISPILVQDRGDYYEIIAGERRWRAARKANLKEVPVIIGNFTEQEIVEISLIENIQRQDLNPIEEAVAYKRLLTEFNLTQDELAERVSKNRVTIANSIRLLKLTEKVQQMMIDGMLTTGHARALLAIEDSEEQFNLAQKVFDEKLSVRDIEKLVKQSQSEPKQKKVENKELAAIYADIAEKLKNKYGTKVTISPKGTDGAGKLEIEFYSHDDLDRLISIL